MSPLLTQNPDTREDSSTHIDVAPTSTSTRFPVRDNRETARENEKASGSSTAPTTNAYPSESSSRPERSAAERSAVPTTNAYAADTSTTPASSGTQNAAFVPTCESSLCTAARAEAAEPLLPEAQRRWAARALPERLEVFRQARHWMAAHPEAFAKAISPDLQRSAADTLVTELLPLLDAIRFLERNARKLLAPRKLGSAGRPLWLTGVQSEIHREPLGHVLVIGPSNFPLFLPGTQAIQALVAGNAVTWKPGAGGEQVALLLNHVLREAGLPRGVLHITDASVEAAQGALAAPPDKVVFTGSFDTGRHILSTLAETATPATMELSGADAVIVLPSADLPAAARAVSFGLRLNGGEVCMSPRRLVATRETLAALRPLLQSEFARVAAGPLKPKTAHLVDKLTAEALADGATILPIPATSGGRQAFMAAPHPLVLDHVSPTMAIAQTDIFAPVLSLIEAPSVLHMAAIVNNNPYGLTAAIFGAPREAETLARELRVGTVLINDLIAPTADPRLPFGGRGRSGFGVTRGGEGLLEMTAVKAVLRRAKPETRHYDPLGARDLPLFSALLGALHGGSLGTRWKSVKAVALAARHRSAKASG